jgi:AcrR family transcriptional regulator
MARPKRVEGEKTAYERIEDAFWELLAQKPYHEMTGKQIRDRAGVSHNTFYYYFENLDDMARKIFNRMATPEVPLALMAAMVEGLGATRGIAERIPDFEQRFTRMRLLAASGSPLLLGLLRNAVVRAWLSAVNLDEADLSVADRADLTFAFGGLMALLGSDLSSDAQVVNEFYHREIGQGVFRTITRLAARN